MPELTTLLIKFDKLGPQVSLEQVAEQAQVPRLMDNLSYKTADCRIILQGTLAERAELVGIHKQESVVKNDSENLPKRKQSSPLKIVRNQKKQEPPPITKLLNRRFTTQIES